VSLPATSKYPRQVAHCVVISPPPVDWGGKPGWVAGATAHTSSPEPQERVIAAPKGIIVDPQIQVCRTRPPTGSAPKTASVGRRCHHRLFCRHAVECIADVVPFSRSSAPTRSMSLACQTDLVARTDRLVRALHQKLSLPGHVAAISRPSSPLPRLSPRQLRLSVAPAMDGIFPTKADLRCPRQRHRCLIARAVTVRHWCRCVQIAGCEHLL